MRNTIGSPRRLHLGGYVGQTDDYVAIRRLQTAYADIISRRAYGELEDIFLPETSVVMDGGDTREVRGPRQFGELVERHVGHLELFQFVILNAVVDLAVDSHPFRAFGRLHICELWKDPNGRSSEFYGLYQDEYTKVDERWWFAHRRFSGMGLSRRIFDVYGYPDLEA